MQVSSSILFSLPCLLRQSFMYHPRLALISQWSWMTLNFSSSCFCFPSAGITGHCHSTGLMWSQGLNVGLCICSVVSQPDELCPQHNLTLLLTPMTNRQLSTHMPNICFSGVGMASPTVCQYCPVRSGYHGS